MVTVRNTVAKLAGTASSCTTKGMGKMVPDLACVFRQPCGWGWGARVRVNLVPIMRRRVG